MKPRHQISRAGIEMIKRFEGYRRRAAKTPDGRWTIGYGHTLTAREGAEVSETDAEALLIYDLIGVAHTVNEHVYTPLTQNEFDALSSFAFNIGVEAFRGSDVLRRLNEGAHLQAACAMELWRRAPVEDEEPVVDALVRRRSAEKALFLTPSGTWVAASSSILRPSLDHRRAGEVPAEHPAAVETATEDDIILLRRAVAPPAEPEAHPATLAAEALTARLATILSDPETRAEEPPAPLPPVEPPVGTEEGLAPLAVLAAIGLALFVGGLYWAFRYAPAAGLSASGAMAVGWLAGVAGVGFFSLAAYRLFERLGRSEGGLSD